MSFSPDFFSPLPSGWKKTQLRRLVHIRNGRDYKGVEVVDGGYPVYGSGGEFRRASEFLYEGESILFGRKGTIDRPLYVNGRFWTVDTMYYAVPNEQVCPRFLYYVATTIPYSYYVTSTALPSITQGDLAGHAVSLPPLNEQQAIADYLDRETQRIDELIAEQRGLIETLRERRQAVIDSVFGAHVVNSRMYAACIDVVDCSHTTPEFDADGDFEAVRTASVRSGNFRAGQGIQVSESTWSERNAAGAPRMGDVLFTREAPAGESCMVPDTKICLGQRMVLLRVDQSRAEGRFLMWHIYSRVVQDYFRTRSNGSTVNNVRLPILRGLPIWLPLLDEQREIVAYLDDQTSRIDDLISESEDLIALSVERRAALITAAVTGQIDVRKAA